MIGAAVGYKKLSEDSRVREWIEKILSFNPDNVLCTAKLGVISLIKLIASEKSS
jgi:hypothetical protein